MNVKKEDIVAIKPGQIIPFICEDAKKMQSAATLVSQIKRLGLPDGVTDYEVQKFFDSNVILIHALGAGEGRVLNK